MHTRVQDREVMAEDQQSPRWRCCGHCLLAPSPLWVGGSCPLLVRRAHHGPELGPSKQWAQHCFISPVVSWATLLLTTRSPGPRDLEPAPPRHGVCGGHTQSFRAVECTTELNLESAERKAGGRSFLKSHVVVWGLAPGGLFKHFSLLSGGFHPWGGCGRRPAGSPEFQGPPPCSQRPTLPALGLDAPMAPCGVGCSLPGILALDLVWDRACVG